MKAQSTAAIQLAEARDVTAHQQRQRLGAGADRGDEALVDAQHQGDGAAGDAGHDIGRAHGEAAHEVQEGVEEHRSEYRFAPPASRLSLYDGWRRRAS